MDAPEPALPRARWLKQGIIDAGGSHEPYLFVVRRGGYRMDAREQYEQAQSEETIRRLAAEGVEVFHTHLYKGFGMAAERPEMEDAVRAAAVAHGLGMRVDSYIQWNTMMYETFFAEEPRAREWVQCDSLGRPILLTYGYQQSFRYRPCFANPEYLNYLERVVHYAVVEVKSDFIHFDNFDLNAEPESCHCPCCVEGFREFLRARYSAEQREERLGFANVDYVNPPQWNLSNPPGRMRIIFDPVIQEWVEFRCQTMADALGRMARYAKGLNPEVVIEVNPHGITGGNRAWTAGIDHARILKWTEAFWTEEENLPAYLPDGRLISKVRSYKLARAFGNVLFTYMPTALAMAEGLAFNQTLGYVGTYPLSAEARKHIAFYRKHRDLYVEAQDWAEVAVLRSHPSITYNHARAQLSAILVEQALLQARVPFRLVFDGHLADLSGVRVLVLADSECLSDTQLEQIERFVAAGGGLVATGQAGLYDQWRRLRLAPGLPGLAGAMGRETRGYEETVGGTRGEAAPAVRREYRAGRVCYLPEVAFEGELPEFGAHFTVDSRFWRKPANADDLVSAVRWAAGGRLAVEVEGPDFLAANLVWQPGRRRAVLHLLNYGADRTPTVDNVVVRWRPPEGGTVRGAWRVAPEADELAPVSVEQADGCAAIKGLRVMTYAMVVTEWG
jgi:hypothetical protein